MVPRIRLTPQELRQTYESIPHTFTEIAKSLALGSAVLRHFFGVQWFDRYVMPTTRKPGFLTISEIDAVRLATSHYRIMDLAEILYNLQTVPGFDECIHKMRRGDIDGTYAELDFGRMLYLYQVPFRYVVPSGITGNDYDIELRYPSGITACGDAKCKLETTKFSRDTVDSALEKARSQLPKTRPADVLAVVPIMQTLFDRDFEPVWNTGLAVTVSAAPAASGTDWPIYLMDTTDIPGAGGYHEDQGLPFGKVFVKDAMDAGEAWTVDLTHEFLEMCGDPTTDVLISLPGMPGYSCLREVGDTVEADQFGYHIGDVLVTDWCTPEYFYQTGGTPPAPNSAIMARGLYDFMDHIKSPAPALLDGGYLGIRAPDGSWSQVSDFVNGVQSRRARRTMGRLNRVARRG